MATAMPRIDDAERRRRMVVRHHLDRSAADVGHAVRDLLAVHSSDPLTPFLALAARVDGVAREDVEAALYDQRSLWRLHAMRRTLFCVDLDDAEDLYLACGHKIMRTERRRVTGWVADALDDAAGDVDGWIAEAEAATLAELDRRGVASTTELRTSIDALDVTLTLGSGRYTQQSALASRLLYLMAMDGRIVRGRPAGSWRASQYAWSTATTWFGTALPSMATYGPGARPPVRAEIAAAQARMAERYLRTHGPAAPADLEWFFGWTKTETRRALAALDVIEVDTEEGPAVVLAGDLAPTPAPSEPVVTLLPSLDPATMGWKQRGWYLGDLDVYPSPMFDSAGNCGPAVLVDGLVVGGWTQRSDRDIVWRLLRDVDPAVDGRIAAEAERIRDWIGADAVTIRFRTPLDKEVAAS